jgi:hypothetical protein
MTIRITRQPPPYPCLHLDVGGRRTRVDFSVRGAVLAEVDPDGVLQIARRLPRRHRRADWVLWDVAAMPLSERRIAAWATAIGRLVGGDVFPLTTTDRTRRHERIEGHLARAGMLTR